MNDKEALYCVEKEIIKYRQELFVNIFDEILGDGVIYGSALSSAYIYSLVSDEKNFVALPYTIAILVASIISLKSHDKYSHSDCEKNMLKKLKILKRNIINGNNPLGNIEVKEFHNYIKTKENNLL